MPCNSSSLTGTAGNIAMPSKKRMSQEHASRTSSERVNIQATDDKVRRITQPLHAQPQIWYLEQQQQLLFRFGI